MEGFCPFLGQLAIVCTFIQVDDHAILGCPGPWPLRIFEICSAHVTIHPEKVEGLALSVAFRKACLLWLKLIFKARPIR